jgi:peptidoglycan/xylan/chitin deacetylase (PgdA/CDA1 family)
MPSFKRAAESLLVASGLPAMAQRWRAGRSLILAYHNVIGTEDISHGDRSLHLRVDDFESQIELIASAFDVVPLSVLLKGSTSRNAGAIALTFDDAYHGVFWYALPVLVRRNLPFTVFVAPDLLGRTTWWDELADPVSGAVPDPLRSHAMEVLAGRTDVVLQWARPVATNAEALPRIATEGELVAASAQAKGLLTLGSHSWSHAQLAALPHAELDAELQRPLRWLRERFTSVIDILSYPYGRWSKTTEQHALDVGYKGSLRIEGGWMRSTPPTQFGLPRMNIPAGITDNGFKIRVAGISL